MNDKLTERVIPVAAIGVIVIALVAKSGFLLWAALGGGFVCVAVYFFQRDLKQAVTIGGCVALAIGAVGIASLLSPSGTGL